MATNSFITDVNIKEKATGISFVNALEKSKSVQLNIVSSSEVVGQEIKRLLSDKIEKHL